MATNYNDVNTTQYGERDTRAALWTLLAIIVLAGVAYAGYERVNENRLHDTMVTTDTMTPVTTPRPAAE